MTSQALQRRKPDWAVLDHMLLGRTLHLNAVSPLHIPAGSDDDDVETETNTDEQAALSTADLDRMTESLTKFLGRRIAGVSVASGARQANARADEAKVQHVRAAFCEMPRQEISDDQQGYSDTTRPWAIEVEIQSALSQTQMGTNTSSNTRRRRKRKTAYAHIVFLSTSKRASPTHYPLLIWKAPPASAFGSGSTQQEQQGAADARQKKGRGAAISTVGVDESSLASTPKLTSRILMTHILDFITRYFDCHLSQQEPLRSVRGTDLEAVSESIIRHHRSHVMSHFHDLSSSIEEYGVDLGYALPALVQGDEVDDEKKAANGGGSVVQGPAPDLNLISLNVPPAILHDLMKDAHADTTVLPAIQHYLAVHTSVQLQRLTLVRIGIANVFIGVPTTTSITSAATRAASQAGAEVRIKFTPLPTSQRAAIRSAPPHGRSGGSAHGQDDTDQSSPMEVERIANVLRHLVRLAERDQW